MQHQFLDVVTTEAMIADKPEEKDAALLECLVEWAVWEEWAAWECNPHCSQTKIQKGQFLLPFFFILTKIISDEGMMKDLVML